MSGHTPGPWKYGKRRDGSFWISLGTPLRTHEQFDWFGENEASLRLACAAPDLLAALKDLLDYTDQLEVLLHVYADGPSTSHKSLESARAAIAKAEDGE
jgi:hypothetical protein